MNTERVKQFFIDNGIQLFIFLVVAIGAWYSIEGRVTRLEGHTSNYSTVHASEIKEVREEVDICRDTNNEIFIKLVAIETKLDLLLDGRIEEK